MQSINISIEEINIKLITKLNSEDYDKLLLEIARIYDQINKMGSNKDSNSNANTNANTTNVFIKNLKYIFNILYYFLLIFLSIFQQKLLFQVKI